MVNVLIVLVYNIELNNTFARHEFSLSIIGIVQYVRLNCRSDDTILFDRCQRQTSIQGLDKHNDLPVKLVVSQYHRLITICSSHRVTKAN